MVDTVDYIVIGAGTSGCVVANRLSLDPAVRVTLLEREDYAEIARLHAQARRAA